MVLGFTCVRDELVLDGRDRHVPVQADLLKACLRQVAASRNELSLGSLFRSRRLPAYESSASSPSNLNLDLRRNVRFESLFRCPKCAFREGLTAGLSLVHLCDTWRRTVVSD